MRRALLPAGIVAASVVLGGCNVADSGTNMVNGKEQFVAKCASCHVLERAGALMKMLGLGHLATHQAFTLSGGERRRVEIARALVLSPFFVLLDEPFTGIDPIAVAEIQKIVRRLITSGIGILITDHNVRETLAITDRAYIIHDGKIFRSGTPEELTCDEEVKKVYLGENFRM